MSPLPTASRIFVEQYCRAVRANEAHNAARLSPGTKTWVDALQALYTRMLKVGSPVKRATMLRKAIDHVDSLKPDDGVPIRFFSHAASRSASLCLATFSAGMHPLQGVDEEGVRIVLHMLDCERNGSVDLRYGIDLAYVCKHAIGRLHERGFDLTKGQATGVLAFAGILGHLTRHSAKHFRGELCLHFGDTLLVGSLKHAGKLLHTHTGTRKIDGTFYDIRTALPADEVRNQDMLEQGRIAAHAVARWFCSERTEELERELAEMIPFLPRREDDHTLRTAVRH